MNTDTEICVNCMRRGASDTGGDCRDCRGWICPRCLGGEAPIRCDRCADAYDQWARDHAAGEA